MKETIYLVVSREKVERMTKNPPSLNRGELPIKVDVTVSPKAFTTPTISQEIYIDEWNEDLTLADVEMKKNFITKDEAQEIIAKRTERMKAILEENGYTVTKKED